MLLQLLFQLMLKVLHLPLLHPLDSTTQKSTHSRSAHPNEPRFFTKLRRADQQAWTRSNGIKPIKRTRSSIFPSNRGNVSISAHSVAHILQGVDGHRMSLFATRIYSQKCSVFQQPAGSAHFPGLPRAAVTRQEFGACLGEQPPRPPAPGLGAPLLRACNTCAQNVR